MYTSIVPAAIRALTQLNACLDKAALHAEAKKFAFEVLLQSRLAPDQFPLVRQIQIACDTAKLGAARLCGQEAPVHEDTETTLAEVKARIESVLAYLAKFTPEDFQGAEERKISQPRWGEQWLSGQDYAQYHLLPNLYFHVTTAYAILRHNGVDVGKKDYLGPMPFKS